MVNKQVVSGWHQVKVHSIAFLKASKLVETFRKTAFRIRSLQVQVSHAVCIGASNLVAGSAWPYPGNPASCRGLMQCGVRMLLPCDPGSQLTSEKDRTGCCAALCMPEMLTVPSSTPVPCESCVTATQAHSLTDAREWAACDPTPTNSLQTRILDPFRAVHLLPDCRISQSRQVSHAPLDRALKGGNSSSVPCTELHCMRCSIGA